jgi:cell division protease FtsH
LGREAILKVHSRNKKVAKDVTLKEIARRTPGFSGADLENLMNEAALLAARENRKNLTLNDIDEAVDRVMMGPAKRSRKYTPKERERVAYHEAGHAVIGLRLSHASVVHKVTIVPRGQAGGYNLMLPDEETFLETKSSLEDKISGFMGGRVAEEIIYNDVSTGAHNDFQRATQIARAMVTEYGMSSLGPIQYERSTGPVFLGRDYTKSRDFSDKVAFDIDNAVREIIDAAYQKSKDVITEHRVLLDTIAHYLLEIETLTFEDIEAIDKTGKLQWWDDKRAEESAEPVIGDTKENAA